MPRLDTSLPTNPLPSSLHTQQNVLVTLSLPLSGIKEEEEKAAFKEYKGTGGAAAATAVKTREASLEERLAEMEASLAAANAEVAALRGGTEQGGGEGK